MAELGAAITVKIASHTNPNHSYTVTFPVNAEPYCECKGFGYRKTCSHIKEAADKLLEQFVQREFSKPALDRQLVCLTCGVPLSGTHAFLDKCAACYRKETFSVAR